MELLLFFTFNLLSEGVPEELKLKQLHDETNK